MITSDLIYEAGLGRIHDLRPEAQARRCVKPASAGPNPSPSGAAARAGAASPQPRRALISRSAGAWPPGHTHMPADVTPVTGRFLPVPSQSRRR
jgi:hypothetical protein